ncbi:MAG: C4-dicarboxylate ABC transporter permease, partial [Chloroflexota bacterium]|nr:C4-dicarboxylate ABC transporter permease [Chloroflexota bacterium]
MRPDGRESPPADEAFIAEPLSEEQARDLIVKFEAEGQSRRLSGPWRFLTAGLAIGLSVYALYVTQVTIQTQIYRTSFLGIALVLTFLLYPTSRRWASRLNLLDVLLAMAGAVTALYPLLEYDSFVRRAVRPTEWDVIMGAALIVLVLEATRRTVGWILPVVAIALLGYG